MGVGSISFWQQDQKFWARAQQSDQSRTLSSAVINNMFGASSTLATGLASIANQTALDRVNSALTAAVQSALQQVTGGSGSTSDTSDGSGGTSSSSSTSSANTAALTAPATGTGTAPVLTTTSLITLGVLKGGAITVSDGSNTTTYKSTGTDTIGDFINAINTNKFGNAAVTASLNTKGQIVLTANNTTASILVGGAYAANIGFGAANDDFQPTTPTASASSSSTAASGSSTASSSGSTSSSTSSTGLPRIPKNSSTALLTGGTAEILLASNGSTGSILDMLA